MRLIEIPLLKANGSQMSEQTAMPEIILRAQPCDDMPRHVPKNSIVLQVAIGLPSDSCFGDSGGGGDSGGLDLVEEMLMRIWSRTEPHILNYQA